MIRKCVVCEKRFEVPTEELTRLEKEGLAIPTRCGQCTARGERFSNPFAHAFAREERRR